MTPRRDPIAAELVHTFTVSELDRFRAGDRALLSTPPRRRDADLLEVQTVLVDALDAHRVGLAWWPGGHAYALLVAGERIILGVDQARRLAETIVDHLLERDAA